MSHQLVLLSPYAYPGSYPLTLADDDMASWLNGYTALWHPALAWQASEPPRIETPYDHEHPKPATIYALPESPPTYLPEDWNERVRQAGSIAFKAMPDRETTLANLTAALEPSDAPALGWKEALIAPPDMLNMFFGIGLGYLLQATLAEAMEHENLLEKVAFWGMVQKSIESMGSTEPGEPSTPEDPKPETVANDFEPTSPAPPDAKATETPAEDDWLRHLREAALKLLAAREVLYPVAIHWLDLNFLSETTFAQPPSTMQLGAPLNFIASAETLESLARQEPEKFALLKTLVQNDAAEICGGSYRERDEALLPYDSQLWNLRTGLEASQRILGKDIRVYARRTFGFHPRTMQLLASNGVTRLLFLTFDDASGIPTTYHSPVVAFSGPDGKQIDAFARVPKSADKVETYFNLGNALFKTTREDHHATLCFLHTSPHELPWHRDLVALSRLAPVLGAWTTFSEYFGHASAGEYPIAPVADDFHFDDLTRRTHAKRPDPVSGYAQHLKIRRRIDACWTYAGLNRALCGAEDTLDVSDLASVERVFETQDALGVEPGGLAELEQHITAALTERLQNKAAANRPGVMLLNPCAFARRYALEIADATAPLPIEGPVKACQLDAGVNRVVVEVPALGFTWLPRSGPAGTPAMPTRMRLGDAKTLTIRNEFFEADVDSQTGGLKAIRDHKTRTNRLGQRLVFNPGSRPVCTNVEVTAVGPALGEIVSEGVLLGEQDQELAKFKQRFRAWLGRPLLEMRIELTPLQPAAGDPWHAYFGARFAWRDERTHLFRGQGGCSHLSIHPRPQTPEFLDLRYGPMATAIFPNGLPFHRKHDGRMLDVILIPEGETTTTFDLGIALDRDQPMLTAWGLASPLAVVPTTKGAPHVGASSWLFHLDLPSLLLTKLMPGSVPGSDSLTAQFLECSGFPAHAELRCLRNPRRATLLNGHGDLIMDCPIFEDAVTIDVSPHDWVQVELNM
jgi:hypothetical protein